MIVFECDPSICVSFALQLCTLLFQNYTIGNLQKHTNYLVTLAAKNLKGLGPNATIELRTEDGGV